MIAEVFLLQAPRLGGLDSEMGCDELADARFDLRKQVVSRVVEGVVDVEHPRLGVVESARGSAMLGSGHSSSVVRAGAHHKTESHNLSPRSGAEPAPAIILRKGFVIGLSRVKGMKWRQRTDHLPA